LVLTGTLGAGSAAGAASGRVGECDGEVLEGVAALLELGVSVCRSFGAFFALGRPRRDLNDRLDVGSSFGGSSFGGSCSLNWAASGCDCEGVSKTATSPTCLCWVPSGVVLPSFGPLLNQKAHPEGFEASFVPDSVPDAGGRTTAAFTASAGECASVTTSGGGTEVSVVPTFESGDGGFVCAF
jgi:hypothetical protein